MTQDDAKLARVVAERYLPFAVTLTLTNDRRVALASKIPALGSMEPVGNKATAYVCRDFACRQPVTAADALTAELATV
jgi:uncharacterized protein YyaL (SSP411 family)